MARVTDEVCELVRFGEGSYSCRCLTSRVHAIPAVVDEASHPRVEIFVAEWLSRTSRTSLCVRWTRVQGFCNMALQGAFECAS